MQADVAEWESQIRACGPRPHQHRAVAAGSSLPEWKPPAPSSSRGSSLPAYSRVPAPPPAPSKSPWVDTEAEHRAWVRDFQYDEEGLCTSWPVPSLLAERAEPGQPSQPKPSQAPYLASEENSEKAQCGKLSLADLRGHDSRLWLGNSYCTHGGGLSGYNKASGGLIKPL